MSDPPRSLMHGEFGRKALVAAGVSVLVAALLMLVVYVARPLLVIFAGLLQHSVDLPPALTVGAQIVTGTVFGLLGIMFATPLTACTLVLVQEAYVEDALGDPVVSEH